MPECHSSYLFPISTIKNSQGRRTGNKMTEENNQQHQTKLRLHSCMVITSWSSTVAHVQTGHTFSWPSSLISCTLAPRLLYLLTVPAKPDLRILTSTSPTAASTFMLDDLSHKPTKQFYSHSHQMAKLTTRASGWGQTHPHSITAFMTKQK